MTADFRDKHQLPESFARTETEFYEPLGQWVQQRLAEREGSEPFVLGINGAQGTGKSTLADFIREYLAGAHDRSAVVLSIDDLYLTRAQRQALAKDVHPLLEMRGVPGTHDVELGLSVIESLKRLEQGQSVLVPRFDKSTDDRFPESEWTEVSDPIDLIIFEGWCVGSEPVPDVDLDTAINYFEAREDPNGTWRSYVNQQLKEIYPPLFELLDALVFLSAPDFDCVLRWRTEQEEKLAAGASARDSRVMEKSQIERFIQHYERITRQNLKSLAGSADVRLELGQDHQVVSAHYKCIVWPSFCMRDFCGSESCIVMHSTAMLSVDVSRLINKNNKLTSEIWIREAGAGNSNLLTPTNDTNSYSVFSESQTATSSTCEWRSTAYLAATIYKCDLR